jgi:hypothetical protein
MYASPTKFVDYLFQSFRSFWTIQRVIGRSVPLGHTDTDSTTCLHVPSIGLVVAGDAAYNGVHLYLGESNPQTRLEWIGALDTIEALNPAAVIAGHKRF